MLPTSFLLWNPKEYIFKTFLLHIISLIKIIEHCFGPQRSGHMFNPTDNSHTGLERNEGNDRISSLFEYAQTTPKSQNNTLFLAFKDNGPFGALQIQTLICDFGDS